MTNLPQVDQYEPIERLVGGSGPPRRITTFATADDGWEGLKRVMQTYPEMYAAHGSHRLTVRERAL